MADFQFLQNPITKKWVIIAPRRAKRPDVAKGTEPVCPFCLGREQNEPEVYRVQDGVGYENWPASHQLSPEAITNWQIRVIPNKFPFAPLHEVIIHSPDHHKSFGELPLPQVELVLQTYRQRYNAHKDKGQVYIFHNRGEGGGESLPHPHSQLAVLPFDVKADIPRLDPNAKAGVAMSALDLTTTEEKLQEQIVIESDNFYMFCPQTSQWPDEVWVAPKQRGRAYGEVTDEELADLAKVMNQLIQIFTVRHNHEFPFNFYIYPGGDWYLRIVPRLKSLGGFEIGTGVYINTQDPQETAQFIKDHFHAADEEKIKTENQADYSKVA